MTDRTDIDIDVLRGILEERKADLLRLSGISKESRDAVELDQTRQGRLSRMDAMQQQEMAKATERRRRQDLTRIEAALTRMGTEDYGYCLSCDEPIPVKRLELDPAVTLCVSCAS